LNKLPKTNFNNKLFFLKKAKFATKFIFKFKIIQNVAKILYSNTNQISLTVVFTTGKWNMGKIFYIPKKVNIVMLIAVLLISSICFASSFANASDNSSASSGFKIINQSSNSNVSLENLQKYFNITAYQSAHAYEKQIFSKFLNQVAGIDTQKYITSYFHVSSNNHLGSEKIETSIAAVIENENEKFDIAMKIVDGKITFYDLDLLSGSLSGTKLDVDSCLKASTNAIKNYQIAFEANYCSNIEKMAPENIKTQNITITNEDSQLLINNLNTENPLRNLELFWRKMINTLTVGKQSVIAYVANNGMLTYFVDNMALYNVASTEIAIDEKSAIAIAEPIIETYAKENGRTVESIKSELKYVSDINGSRGDSCLIYPQWTVLASFGSSDKTPIYGYCVSIWADSGEIHHKDSQGNYQMINSNSGASSEYLVIILLLIVVIPIGLLAYMKSQKQISLIRKTTKRIGGLIAIAVLVGCLTVIQPVSANPTTVMGSTVDWWDLDENWCSETLSNQICTWADIAGYTTYNWRGASTTRDNFYVAAYDHGYSGSIVYHMGHGRTSPTYEIVANNGEWVSESDIYANSYAQAVGHKKIAVIWSCFQGDSIGEGAYAWLHTTSLSADGYNSVSDFSGQAFLGWYGLAPYLKNDELATDAGFYFMMTFFCAFLLDGYSIKHSLDNAAVDVFDGATSFGDCDYGTGWSDDGWHRLMVYGQGSLHAASQEYVSGVTNYAAGYYQGYVYTPYNLEGAQDDGNYAYLVAGTPGDWAWITGQMNTAAGDHIRLTGMTGVGYSAYVLIYVSTNNQDWDLAAAGTVTGSDPHEMYLGYWTNYDWNYMGIAVQYNNEPSALAIDAVHIERHSG